MNPRIFLAVVIFAAEMFAGAMAHGGCKQLFVHHAQPVVAVPVYPLYFAGQATQDEALIRKAIRAELPAIIQQLQAAQPQQQTVPQDYASSLLQKSVMVQKCNKCHSSNETRLTNPDGTLDPMKFRAFARMAGLGKDIPDQMRAVIASLTPEEKGNITEALLALPPPKPAKPEPQVLPPEPGVLR